MNTAFVIDGKIYDTVKSELLVENESKDLGTKIINQYYKSPNGKCFHIRRVFNRRFGLFGRYEHSYSYCELMTSSYIADLMLEKGTPVKVVVDKFDFDNG